MTPPSQDQRPSVRVLVDEQPSSGAWNMAVDELLLESAVTTGRCSLRWYRWNEATLSLGYFQKPDDAQIEDRFAQLPRVRRLSGGGAILHDRELTYSCAVGADHPLAVRPLDLYAAMHAAIVRALAGFGISLCARGRADKSLDAAFLCFHRGSADDLLCGHDKVLGSAQRRRRGAVLQHGSLLLRRSSVAPEFPGIQDLCEESPPVSDLLPALIRETAGVLGGESLFENLTDSEQRIAAQFAARSNIGSADV